MMRFTRGLAVGVVVAGAAVGLAATASAELTDGTYQQTFEGQPPGATFVVTSCGAGCKVVKSANGAGVTLEYHLQGNTWSATMPSGASVISIDNNTLAGSFDTGGMSENFQWVKVG